LSRGDEFEPASSGPSSAPLSGFDAFLANNLSLLIIIVGCCCTGLVPGVIGVVGLITCKDPTAKRNALILAIVGGVLVALQIIGFAVRGTQGLNVK
jgi:hypothetical protein